MISAFTRVRILSLLSALAARWNVQHATNVLVGSSSLSEGARQAIDESSFSAFTSRLTGFESQHPRMRVSSNGRTP
jgi:hypothetical protein